MKLHEAPSDFELLIRSAAQDAGILDVYVEKDYWLTLLLKRLSEIAVAADVVFKGGTSLSKAYGLAKRFSEEGVW